MENLDTIVLKDEEGKEIEFEILTKLDIEDKEYLVVVPADDDEVDAIALRIDVDEEGNDVLSTVEDDNEFQMVSEAYELIFSEDNIN